MKVENEEGDNRPSSPPFLRNGTRFPFSPLHIRVPLGGKKRLFSTLFTGGEILLYATTTSAIRIIYPKSSLKALNLGWKVGGGTGENGDRMFPRANCISLFLDSIDNVCLVRLFGSSNFHGVTSLILVVDEERREGESWSKEGVNKIF